MNAEIISVGSNLLKGQVINQNAAYLARQLTSLGMNVRRISMIHNKSEDLENLIKVAEERADFLVLTGGLGPSDEDITKKVISAHLDVPLVLDRPTEDRIITYHKNSDFTMPENNQLQALVLQGSSPIRNITGLAAGMFFQKAEKTYLLLPGPMDEMKPMFEEEARSLIIERLLREEEVATRSLRLYGVNERQVTAGLEDLLEGETNPFIGVYTKDEQVEVEITARADSMNEAKKNADEVEEEIEKRFEKYVFSHQSEALSDVVKDLLKEEGKTVTAAESLTGGAFLSALSSELEAGSIFNGGIVTYSSDVKHSVLGVRKKTIDIFGVVSSQCAIEMAEKSMKMFDADIGVSLTGVAGPSSLEGKIPGTVWIGIAQEGKETFAKQYHFAFKRNRNRTHAVLSAMNLVRLVLLDEPIDKKVFWDDKFHGDETKEEQQ